jgi:hypothetical protein
VGSCVAGSTCVKFTNAPAHFGSDGFCCKPGFSADFVLKKCVTIPASTAAATATAKTAVLTGTAMTATATGAAETGNPTSTADLAYPTTHSLTSTAAPGQPTGGYFVANSADSTTKEKSLYVFAALSIFALI